MAWLGTLFLYLHIADVIVAFGPLIALPIIGARAAKEPMHGNFALRTSAFISERVVLPGAVFVFLMGVGLIWSRGWNPFTELWLGLAIVLLLVNIGYAYFVQLPTVKKMVELTNRPPAFAGAAAQPADMPMPASLGTAPGPGAESGGPPPEFVALSAKAVRGGQFLTAMIFVILALMVVKPV